MSISEEVRSRGITEIIHFTTNNGLVGMLAGGVLLSRRRLPEEKYLQHILSFNSAVRPEAAAYFDKSKDWLDYVNLSVSEVNSRFFRVSRGWHSGTERWWALLAFDPCILDHGGVEFATTNNGYDGCMRLGGAEGFRQLFAEQVLRKRPRWWARRVGRETIHTTCEQAEVLYPEGLSLDFLRKIYVCDDEHADLANGWLREFGRPEVGVVVDPVKFEGRLN